MEILILEDEIPAFKKLHAHLLEYFGEALKYDWVRSNFEALEILTKNKPYDVILSDIQLLDGTCFDIADKFPPSVPIIFCSAYDEYLFQAFQSNGIAYILKPYTNEDFKKALEKYKMIVHRGKYQTINVEVVKTLKNALINEENNYKRRFVIKKNNGIKLVNANEVSYFEAAGDFCRLIHFSGEKHTISQSIGSLVKNLNPKIFYRINRSQIVNIQYINSIESYFKNRLILNVKGVKEKVMTSSGSTAEFRKWLEG